jgi:enoyl-CoA hydratase
MDASRYSDLVFSREGRVLTITLNSPATLNAASHRLHEELSRVFYEAADDPESDVIIVTGAGRAFSAGGDVNWMKDSMSDVEGFVLASRAIRRVVHSIIDCPKPMIAKVNGDAIGFGASVALLCDVVIAAETANFADPHVRLGLVAGDGGALIWPQLIGFGKARHYLLTGDPINAVEAERLGLIAFAVPAAELDAFTAKYAAKLERGAQTAIRYTKTITNIPLRQFFNSVFEAGVAYEGLSQQTADFREGVQSFLEKRRPDYSKK